jgi:tripartite-type tricarboxylate transporter receptor subunit TctC
MASVFISGRRFYRTPMAKRHAVIMAIAAVSLFASAATERTLAADYPTKPIHLISSYSPGGGNDISARIIGEALSQRLGQPVIVENRAGASGLIGSDYVVKSAPDGYTLLFASVDTVTMVPALKPNMPYRVPEDFTYIARTSENGMTFAINAKLPYTTLPELINYAKANPDKIHYGTNGVGAAPHLSVELFMKHAGIRMQHIPYKGVSNAMTDLVGGHIDFAPLTPVTISPYLNSDALRIIAYTGAQRHPLIPNVPTLAELGMPQATVSVWYSILGPAKMPPAVTERLRREVAASLADPVVKTKLEKLGSTVAPVYGDAFEKMVVDELKQWKQIARDENIVLD